MKQTLVVTMHVTMPITIEEGPNASSSELEHEAYVKKLRLAFNLKLKNRPKFATATELVSVFKSE